MSLTTIVDTTKEQNMGVFQRKVVEDGCHLRHTELESPWQMDAEGGVCELKKGSGIKMTKINHLKCFGTIVWRWKHTYAPTRIWIFSSRTG